MKKLTYNDIAKLWGPFDPQTMADDLANLAMPSATEPAITPNTVRLRKINNANLAHLIKQVRAMTVPDAEREP